MNASPLSTATSGSSVFVPGSEFFRSLFVGDPSSLTEEQVVPEHDGGSPEELATS